MPSHAHRVAVLILVVTIAAAVGLAYHFRFICDDAFISFTYARSLVRGEGLTWFGDRVEGYTNFLWVLWIALGMKLHIEPIRFAWGGGLASMLVTLVVTNAIAIARTQRAHVGLFAVAMLATNYTFLCFATSGLETMLQTALLAAAWLDVERSSDDRSIARYARASTLLGLAILTRLDSVVLASVLCVATLIRARPSHRREWAAALAPGVVLVGAWFAFKLAYYGDLLPNTFHAKVGRGAAFGVGLQHAARFLHWYGLWPCLLVGAVLAATGRRLRALALPAAMVATWCAYVVLVGGDFMEFRFFVPAMPALFVLIAEMICTEVEKLRLVRPLVTGSLVTGVLAPLSAVHANTFTGVTEDRTLDSIQSLATLYGKVHGDWWRAGTGLGRALRGTGATISCNGAGAIPFYSDLHTVDQLGLTDAWVARNGVKPGDEYRRPGHQRFAPLSYLEQRKVTFVLGSPRIVRRGHLRSPEARKLVDGWLTSALGPAAVPVSRLVLVAIPIDEKDSVVGWYLTPSPAVEQRIVEQRWEVIDLRVQP